MKKITVLAIGIFLVFMALSACGSVVKITPQNYMENPETYKGKRVILTTNIKSVIEDQETLLGKKIELSGSFKENKFNDFKDWGFTLADESGRLISCYEFETRDVDFIEQEIVLRRAKKENELVTVVGTLRRGPRIELETFETGGHVYYTDKLIQDYE